MRDLPTPRGEQSCAFDINEHGQAVGNSGLPDGESHAFLWDRGTARELAALEGLETQGFSINDRAQVVGFTNESVFFWENGRAVNLGQGRVTAMNQRGQVLIGEDIDVSYARVWHRGAVTRLDDVTGTVTTSRGVEHGEVAAINDSGIVVGSDFSPTLPTRACLWRGGHMRRLGALAGGTSRAVALNNHGQIVGRSSVATVPRSQEPDLRIVHAVVWDHGRISDLGTLGELNSEAVAINEASEIIGAIVTKQRNPATGASRQTHAMLWTRRV